MFCFTAYTDEYEGQKRDVEIGVLFGDDDSVAVPVRLFVAFPCSVQLCDVCVNLPIHISAELCVHIASAAECRISQRWIRFAPQRAVERSARFHVLGRAGGRRRVRREGIVVARWTCTGQSRADARIPKRSLAAARVAAASDGAHRRVSARARIIVISVLALLARSEMNHFDLYMLIIILDFEADWIHFDST